MAIGMTQCCLDPSVAWFESENLDLTLDSHSESLQTLFEKAFGVRLRQHQAIRERTLDRLHTHVAHELAITCNEIHRQRFEPGFDEGRCTSRPTVQQFKGPTPQHQSFGFVCSLRRLVDDANWNSEASKLAGRGHSDRAGSRDQDFKLHRNLDVKRFCGDSCIAFELIPQQTVICPERYGLSTREF